MKSLLKPLAVVAAVCVLGLVALARAYPGKLNFGSSGAGSITHLTGELLGAAAKSKILHVPYKGSPPVLTALISGEIDMGVLQVVELLPYYRVGRIRPLAVSGAVRSAVIADVPTVRAGVASS